MPCMVTGSMKKRVEWLEYVESRDSRESEEWESKKWGWYYVGIMNVISW
jgi:hypothetical protein